MRKVVLFIADSLDGFIARKNDQIDWLFTDGDYGYKAFYESIDTVLMGRKTFQKIIEMGGEYHYSDKINYIFTHNEDIALKDDYMHVVSKNISHFINEIKRSPGMNIWLVGGGEVVKYFLNENLLDEIILSIHPKILGDGIPLFPSPLRETDLILKDVLKFESGLVQLHYEVLR
ncbi:MAG: dihydrofolate reductase family protein [Bacteroidota bacterium]|nr:dihydrofolate reductase family protein [Bacteroidota bacterium]MDP4190754.1 dihydrofolate reductase family protein [Bacteroidota bacterium]MDP4194664.1 dihydrofolate reductase family protein [Bacteroidota bacterium]